MSEVGLFNVEKIVMLIILLAPMVKYGKGPSLGFLGTQSGMRERTKTIMGHFEVDHILEQTENL